MGDNDFARLQGWVQLGAHRSAMYRYPALAAAWLALWQLSSLMQYEPHASVWFAPAGLTFAALLVMGWRALPVLVPGAMLATLWLDRLYQTGAPPRYLLAASAMLAGAHCLSYGTGALLLRRAIRRRATPSAPAVVTGFLLTAAIAALAAALLGERASALAGLGESATMPGSWLRRWISDLAGVLVLAPLVVGVLSLRYPAIEPWLGGLSFRPRSRGRGGYVGKLALGVATVLAVLLASTRPDLRDAAFALSFLVIPQLWIVHTEGPLRSAASLALFATIAAVTVAVLGTTGLALACQFAICLVAASTCFGLAVPALIAQSRPPGELALSDGLTQAATRGYFFECAERELAEAHSQGLPVSLIVLDIDGFRQINDRFGHATGDRVLVTVVQALRSHLRRSDRVGRFGSDEFMVLLPGLALDRAQGMAARLMHALESLAVPGLPMPPSARFGVVGVGDGESITDAFRRADARLLAAQRDRQAATPGTV